MNKFGSSGMMEGFGTHDSSENAENEANVIVDDESNQGADQATYTELPPEGERIRRPRNPADPTPMEKAEYFA